jgi:gas vesicle protein
MRKAKFIIGAIIGAIAGLAFAPKKGSKLREEITEGFKKGNEKGGKVLLDNAKIMGEDISTTAQEAYHDPLVQQQIKIARKEAGKVADQVKVELGKRKGDLEKAAKSKLIDLKKRIIGTGTKKTAGSPKPTINKAKTKSIPIKKK